MATLVLTAVGTAIGGPLGGAIGGLIGQQIDGHIFAPKGRQGPRLGDLAVQTSSYGSAIPKIFGKMRVAGTVIWATDLQERQSTDGGGKGQPEITTYSYSASFAVALSARRVKDVGRIWADGKLLRGQTGDFKSRVTYRLYTGSEDQPVDPLIAATEGLHETPAFRGIAYAVFEDLELADFGNRIPSLTFEIVADEAAVYIGGVGDELSGREVREGGTPTIGGYAASGDSVRSAIEALADMLPLSLVEAGDHLRLQTRPDSQTVLVSSDTGAGSGNMPGRDEMRRGATGSLPAEVTIAFYDPARDYQAGIQRASTGGPGAITDRRALPAVLSADAAKSFAEYQLASAWAGRATAKVGLSLRHSSIRPGDHVRFSGHSGLWKVGRWTLDRMVVRAELAAVPSVGIPQAVATPGRPIGSRDQVTGTTVFLACDLPLGGTVQDSSPQVLLLCAGTGAGWRHADLMMSSDDGQSWRGLGRSAAPAVIGHTLSALAPAGSAIIDARNSVTVELLHDAMWLESRDDEALVRGANLALIGREVVQFGTVEPLGAARFRLSRLLRGRGGTEWAAPNHVAGEPFALLRSGTAKAIPLPQGSVGSETRFLAYGLGDPPEGVSTVIVPSGDNLRPPSPVHLTAEVGTAGDVRISWVRRSRVGWTWLSGSDTALGEETEQYELTIVGSGGAKTLTIAEPDYVYGAAQQQMDGNLGALTLKVVQIGTFARSRTCQITIDR